MSTLISFTVQDADGDENTIPIYGQDGLTLAQYAAAAQAYADLIDVICGGIIVRTNLTVGITLTGLDTVVTSGIENQRGGLFTFSTPGRFSHSIRVPSMLTALFTGKSVDLNGTGIPEWVTAIESGVAAAGATFVPENGHGEDLVALVKAVKSHRRK